MRLVAFLLVLFVGFSAWQHVRLRQNEERLARVASALAGRDVGVGCPGFWTRLVEITPYGGWVALDEHGRPGDEATLAAATCRGLERLWRREEPATFACLERGTCSPDELAIVQALLTLAHESWHLRGVVNEAQTQCYAVQSAETAAQLFGVAGDASARVAAWVAAHDARQPQWEYRDPRRCRPSGEYDLRPDTAGWPG